ncbi:MAG: DUF3592 domain-containing protein [Sarcina sp.]
MKLKKENIIHTIALIITLYVLYISFIKPTVGFIAQGNLLINGGSTTAKIVNYETSSYTSRGSTTYTYTPILEYKVNGQTFTSNDNSNSSSNVVYPVGTAVNIKYDKASPTNVSISNGLFIIDQIVESSIIYLWPFLVLLLFGIASLTRKDADNKNILSLQVPLRKKIRACFAAIGLPIYGVILLAGQYVNINVYGKYNIVLILLGILLIILYIGLIFTTIKTVFNPIYD